MDLDVDEKSTSPWFFISEVIQIKRFKKTYKCKNSKRFFKKKKNHDSKKKNSNFKEITKYLRIIENSKKFYNLSSEISEFSKLLEL